MSQLKDKIEFALTFSPKLLDRGQGLGNAITDAAELQSHLRAALCEGSSQRTPAQLATAIHEYEKEFWVRGRETVLANSENSNSLHDWETIMKRPLFVGACRREGDKIRVKRKGDSASAGD